MKRGTAIKNPNRLIENCERLCRLPGEPVTREAYVFGEILRPDVATLDRVEAAIVLDHPPDEVTWWALPAEFTFLAHELEVQKIPVRVFWRPAAWPVWNHRIDRPVRIWSHDGGLDEAAVDAVRTGDVQGFRQPAPSLAAAAAQAEIERDASLTYLRTVLDNYHEPKWRREHKGFGVYPDDHLWSAAYGYLETLDACTPSARA